LLTFSLSAGYRASCAFDDEDAAAPGFAAFFCATPLAGYCIYMTWIL
jgi:hypothetical protein